MLQGGKGCCGWCHKTRSARNYLRGCAWGGSTDLSSSTQAPPQRNKRKNRTTSSVTWSTLKQNEEGGAICTRDKETLKVIKVAVQDELDSFCHHIRVMQMQVQHRHHYQGLLEVLLPRQAFTVLGYCPSRIMLMLTTQLLSRMQHLSIHQARGQCKKLQTKWTRSTSFQRVVQSTMTLSNYNKMKTINKSPIKRGPKPTVSSTLLDLLWCHDSMCQLSGTGECWTKSMKAIIGAARKKSHFKESPSLEYI